MRVRVVFVSILLCFASAASLASWAHAGEADYPRLANYYLHGHVDYSHLKTLSNWDVLILNTVWTEQQLAALRANNPDIKIYLYVCIYCIESPANPQDPWSAQLHRYAEDHHLWWYNVNGNVASDWPGSRMINVVSPTMIGPVGDWLNFLALMIQQLVLDRPSIDGVFFDNFWRHISWNQKTLRLDSDCNPVHNPQGCDGVPDAGPTLDYYWNQSMRKFATRIRQSFDALQESRPRPLSIISNSSSDYFESLNGTLHEFFPGGSQPDYGGPHGYAWREHMFQWPGGYLMAPFRSAPYRVSILNASWRGTTLEPTRSQGFERHKRFTLGSSLLGDGYYSLDAGLQGHGNVWWEPEYDNGGLGKGYLGQPIGAARSVVPIGPSNFVSNGDFSEGLQGWTTAFSKADGDAFVTTSPAGNVLQLSLRTLVHTGGHARVSQNNVPLTRDKAHTLRFTAQTITPTELEVNLTSGDCPDGECMRTWRFGVTSEPREYALSFIGPASTDARLDFTIHSPGLLRLRNVSLRNGSRDIYRRDFDNGVVIVNYTTKPQLVDLGEPLTRLALPGSAEFDGRSVQEDRIASGDAMIYLKQVGSNKSTPQGPTSGAIPGATPGATPQRAMPSESMPQDGVEPDAVAGSQRVRLRVQPTAHGTDIAFELPQSGRVGVRVFDVRGRLIRELQSPRPTAAGMHHLFWRGDDTTSRPVGAGVYFVQLQTPTRSIQRKVVLVR